MDFWHAIFFFLFIAPLLLLWIFAMFDIFRRHDLSGVMKALWLVVVLVLPWLGTLIYMIMRPRGLNTGWEEPVALSPAAQPALAPPQVAPAQPPAAKAPVDQLAALGDLRDRGVLTEEEFQQEKARILAASSATHAATSGVPTVSMPTVALPPMELQPTASPSSNGEERG
jgi:hypothetical protein